MQFRRYLLFPLVVLAVWLAPGVVLGALNGDPAPALNVREWLKGGPVEIKPGTNVYVLEILEIKFQAGLDAITNLSDLQRRFKDRGAVMVAVSDESAGVLKQYVLHNGTNIDFAMAADNGRHTSLAFMKPINRFGIPYSFIIGTNGNLLWHGIPQHGQLEEALTRILDGKYNVAAAAKNDLALHQLEQYVTLARQGSDRTRMAGQRILLARTNDLPLLLDLANAIATVPKLVMRDFDLADQALKQAEALAPTNPPSIEMVRAVWYFESGQREEGLKHAEHATDNSRSPQEKDLMQKMVVRMKERMNAPRPAKGDNAGAEPELTSPVGQNADIPAGQDTNSPGKP